MAVIGIALSVLVICWSWLTGRMSVRWKVGQRWRCGALYINSKTRLLFHSLSLIILPILCVLMIGHFLAIGIVLLTWYVFFLAGRYEFRLQALRYARMIAEAEGIEMEVAMVRAYDMLAHAVQNPDC